MKNSTTPPSTAKNLAAIAKRHFEDSTEFKVTRGFALEHDRNLIEALAGTPFYAEAKEISQLRPKLDDDGYLGADFDMVFNDGSTLPAEIYAYSVGLVLFFRKPPRRL
jgi:hypothetical protein